MKSVLIGILSYEDLLLMKQILKPVAEVRRGLEQLNVKVQVSVMDTAWSDELHDFLHEHYGWIEYVRDEAGNIGYGQSFNHLLKLHPEAEALLAVTSDVLLDPKTTVKIFKAMQDDPELMMAAGKLHHWDLNSSKQTQEIDSLGIWAQRRHHFADFGHGELDRGQYDDRLNEVLGISGAVFWLRTSVLKSLHMDALFDPRMWMYKEDIDLAYRLRWAGKKLKVFPEVWAWHGRTLANKEGQSVLKLAKADRGKHGLGRRHSYKNHLLLLKNNLSFGLGLSTVLMVVFYEILKAGFLLFRSPRALVEGFYTLLFVRRRRSNKTVSAAEIRPFFH